jgi:hypothetical protein
MARHNPAGGIADFRRATREAARERDEQLHRARSSEVADRAAAAGFRVAGLIAFDLGWRPGVVLAHSLSDRVWEFAVANGYVASPNGRRRTTIEVAS